MRVGLIGVTYTPKSNPEYIMELETAEVVKRIEIMPAKYAMGGFEAVTRFQVWTSLDNSSWT
jgi:hypothetical protein